MAAGQELSVAATKTFVASVAILLSLAGTWASERPLRDALDRLPNRLAEAARLDWSNAMSFPLQEISPSLVVAQHLRLRKKHR
jgi:glucosamine--fructose-6-phosphate aminotransferase (isomerizing)